MRKIVKERDCKRVTAALNGPAVCTYIYYVHIKSMIRSIVGVQLCAGRLIEWFKYTYTHPIFIHKTLTHLADFLPALYL